MSGRGIAIGEASRQSGVKVPTIRYYEQIGLLPAAYRLDNNRRTYDMSDLHRLAFIRHARELGFDIEAVRTLLSLQDDREQPCSKADAIARAHLDDVEQRISRLQALRAELLLMVEDCRHGKVRDCRVIEVLADHTECQHHHQT